MASLAPARCGVTATWRAFQTCPWQISFASPRTIWHAASSLADRGGGSVRENPLRSLHWELTQEKQMMATGLWQDTVYSACCFMGARCKAQRLRHNIDEIAQWPALHCHHTHAADEWQPYLQRGQRVFPSKEEAEYTASLAFGIAVSASWWAARMGLAKLHVPRFPFVESAGRREHWLQIDPRALREWAMAPTAIALGLRPTHPPGREGKDTSSDTRGGRHLGRQDLATWGRLCGTRPPQPSPPSH